MAVLEIIYFQIHFVRNLSNLTFHFQTFPLNWHIVYLKHFSFSFKVSFVFKRNDNDFRNKNKMNLNFGRELQHLVAANWPSLFLFKILEAVTNFGAPTFLKSSYTIIDGKHFLRSPTTNLLNMFWKSYPTRKKRFWKTGFIKTKVSYLKKRLLQSRKTNYNNPQ